MHRIYRGFHGGSGAVVPAVFRWCWQTAIKSTGRGGGTLSVLYMGIGCSWLAYLLWNKGMNKVPANVSGLLISLEPVIGVIMAVLILCEHLSSMAALGITVVISSTFVAGVLARIGSKHKKAV